MVLDWKIGTVLTGCIGSESMADIEKVIQGLEFTKEMITFNPLTGKDIEPGNLNESDKTTYDACVGAIALLKPFAESKRPDNLRERHAGRIRVYIGDCPVCHRVVEFAQKHCHDCCQLLDWTEVLETSCEDDFFV